jgi:tight adherence protein B
MDILQWLTGNSFLIVSVLVFITVMLVLESLYLIWKTYKGSDATRIQHRLRALSTSRDTARQAQLLKQKMLSDVPAIERILHNLPNARYLNRIIHQAGLTWTVSRLLLTCAAAGVAYWMVFASLAYISLLWGALGGLVFAALPLGYVYHVRSKRLRKIELQLPDALDLMTRALRSGHAFSSSLQMLGEEMSEPVAGEFRIVHDEVNFGVSLQQALINLSERVPITDLRYFVVSVLIQRESGGNLTEVLANLSRLIRERLKLMGKIRVLSSEGRLSAWVLGVMPFALGAIMNFVNPAFMSPLWTDPIGIAILKCLLVMMTFGILVLIKIVKIRV